MSLPFPLQPQRSSQPENSGLGLLSSVPSIFTRCGICGMSTVALPLVSVRTSVVNDDVTAYYLCSRCTETYEN